MTIELSDYIEGVTKGDRRVLAKAITLVESRHVHHRRAAADLIETLLPHTGKAIRLGITGMPGAGKSTFIENFGLLLLERGHKIAVLAVDPSSTRSGGSILADKTRMQQLSQAENAFIRPAPSGGILGGVAQTTREAMLICEAAGFDVVVVETMGVGQSETAVAAMVDFFLVLIITGAGDELQGIKRGILELAHAVAVNKADGNNIQKAEQTRKELQSALHLLSPPANAGRPPVICCSALMKTGLKEIWQIIQARQRNLSASGELKTLRSAQALQWMRSMIEAGLKERFIEHPDVARLLPQIETKVQKGCLSPLAAARDLLFLLDKD